MGFPYPYFCLCAFLGALPKLPGAHMIAYTLALHYLYRDCSRANIYIHTIHEYMHP